MRPFLFSFAILAGSAILVFLVFAAIQVAIQMASLLPAGSLASYEVVGLLNALATHVIATTATVVISFVAGRWLWINKNVHPLLFKIAIGIVLGVVIAFILYMVWCPVGKRGPVEERQPKRIRGNAKPHLARKRRAPPGFSHGQPQLGQGYVRANP
jgi:hypothetical protein